MNTSPVGSELSDYAAVVWGGRRAIAAITTGCVAVMAVLTWAVTPTYLIRAVIDTGALAQAQPVETNLLVEAVDRDQFKPGAGLFPETMPKGLTVVWRAPSTMVLEVKSVDPVDALRRLQTMTTAVHAELTLRFQEYAAWAVDTHEQAAIARDDANASVRRLRRLFEERSATAIAIAAEAHADRTDAASQRAAFQLSAEARLRQPLLRLREQWISRNPDADERPATAMDPPVFKALDLVLSSIQPDDDAGRPENVYAALERDELRRGALDDLSSVPTSMFADLPGIFPRITGFDLRIARAAERERSAERQRRRDEQGLTITRIEPVESRGSAEALVKHLDDLVHMYKEDDPIVARVVEDAAGRLRGLIQAYAQSERAREGPSLKRVPTVVAAPSMPAAPAWPRPAVNLIVAFLFGFAASVTIVVFTAAGSRQTPA